MLPELLVQETVEKLHKKVFKIYFSRPLYFLFLRTGFKSVNIISISCSGTEQNEIYIKPTFCLSFSLSFSWAPLADNQCVIDYNSLPRRKSNSVTTCWGGSNPSGSGQSDTEETWSVNLCACESMSDRESLHLNKNGLFSNVHKSFHFHLCAGLDPKVINHSPVVTKHISTAPVPLCCPVPPAATPSINPAIFFLSPSHCCRTGTAPSDYRMLGADAQSYFLFAQGTHIGCQPSVV